MTRSQKRYMLHRRLPDGQVKSWSQPMRRIEARRAVFFCLIYNSICSEDEAKPVAEQLEDNPSETVAFKGYKFWLEPV